MQGSGMPASSGWNGGAGEHRQWSFPQAVNYGMVLTPNSGASWGFVGFSVISPKGSRNVSLFHLVSSAATYVSLCFHLCWFQLCCRVASALSI